MKNIRKLTWFTALVAVIALTACSTQDIDSPSISSDTGSISGKALFNNSTSHSGITVLLEQTDGLRSSSVFLAVQNIALNAESISLSRSVTAATQTATDGSYSFTGLEPGLYTIYASSQNSKEKAVAVNISLEAGKAVTVADLNLTAVGSVIGRVQLDGKATGNGR